jgi:rubrerythrin
MDQDQLNELLYQAFETENGGVRVYRTALRCVENDDLKEEFQKYHDQTTRHVEIVQGLLETFGLDPSTETAGRKVVRTIGDALIQAMELALEEGPPGAAEVVASECVTLAETKDHLNWELLGEISSKVKGNEGKQLKDAVSEVEEQEDKHLYHTRGWTRELWIQALGEKAALPPPEEEKDVTTEIGAARAQQARKEYV